MTSYVHPVFRRAGGVRALALLSLVLAVFLLFPLCARGETARDLTRDAKITVSKGKKTIRHMLDGSYRTTWADQRRGAFVCFELPENEPCFGLYVTFSNDFSDYVLQAEKNGAWETIYTPPYRYNNQYLPVEGGASKVRLYSPEKGLVVSTVRLLSDGELPDDVETFGPPCEKADLMLIATHPDDDILWFGGLLPTYAGEKKMNVQVVYMTARYSFRKNELLDGLWTCGVRNGPIILGYKDEPGLGKLSVFESWGGRNSVVSKLAALYRRFRPEVVVTQDKKGEYGHSAHVAAVSACIAALREAADKNVDALPAWQVKKMYLHLYGDHPLVMDWNAPLSAFGGKTGLEVAKEAYKKHVSQQSTKHAVEDFGPYDCRLLGLFYSSVGEDVERNDLFEHIPLAQTAP